jgi:hypothetical protein
VSKVPKCEIFDHSDFHNFNTIKSLGGSFEAAKFLTRMLSLIVRRDFFDLGKKSGIGPCFPLAGGLCKVYANAEGKQPIQRQLLLVQYKQQASPLLLTHNYTPLVISRNDKNKQLTNSKPT